VIHEAYIALALALSLLLGAAASVDRETVVTKRIKFFYDRIAPELDAVPAKSPARRRKK